ncbi:hypothetical protein KUTeg_004695 [Tegillarca granosa]|uniref:Uncharacterized protein n=1 Tax=Tegillarca granosa TaxID=220873 RepID=A0ABQ9FHJ7_TEGGR|nr:hypothetical protein KUTeg_004695 [Tegillarca granosa]
MDETYINSSHTVSKCWQLDGNGLSVPIGPGDRLIVVDAGSEKGFVPNTSLIYKAKSSTGDYYHEMNAENFTKLIAKN